MSDAKRSKPVLYLTQAAVIAAAYVVLTLPLAQFAFGPVQFRLAEALTVLAALSPAAVPGLFLGCLLANLFNPQNLGPVDILGGSLTTLAAAAATWQLRRRRPGPVVSPHRSRWDWLRLLFFLSPSVVLNAWVVGLYLPFLVPDLAVTVPVVLATMLSILLSQALVVYAVGLPLLLALLRTKLMTGDKWP
ncbi:MAG: QueT transporter family protein [Clostridiaceae bacterium]|nr:QueT transporter family protein [Clostridiaceae bacterium]